VPGLPDILSLSNLSSPTRTLKLAATTRAQRVAIILLVAAVVAELVVWAVLPFNGYDSYSHIFWIGEWHKLWSAGIFYPRWMPDSFGGFGAPAFYFYPPLTFFLSSALYVVLPALTAPEIGKALSLLISFASFGSVWLYLRWRSKEARDRWTNVLAALFYAFTLYRFFDYSVRGAISEHIAFVWMPFAFWGIDLILERRKARDVSSGFALLTLALSLLALTNLPITATVGICLVLYILFGERNWSGMLGWLGAATVASLVLCAIYVVPLVARFTDVQLNRLWRPESILLTSPFTALLTGENITINIVTFVTLIGACILYFSLQERRLRRLMAVIVILQLPFVSYYLFHFVPPFTIVQLSYRLFAVVILIAAIAWQRSLRSESGNLTSYLVAFWSVVVLGLSLQLVSGIHVHKYGDWPIGEAPEYATRWEKPYIEYGASLHYIAALSQPFRDSTQSAVIDAGILIKTTRSEYSDTIEYSTSNSSKLIVRRTWWPMWSTAVDGISVPTTPDSLGRLSIPVPSGNHRIVVWFANDPLVTVSSRISLIGLILFVTLLFVIRVRTTSRHVV
jgi:hypothetical protein